VLGKIPASRLYQPGLNILNWYPRPTMTTAQELAAGVTYNWERIAPDVSLTGWQPVIRIDYHPLSKLQTSFKFMEYQQSDAVVPGEIPGWDDSKEDNYGIYVLAGTASWAMGPTTFFEFSWGANYHHQEGCSVNGGEPNFCTDGIRINESDSRIKAGMGNIPYIFPNAVVIPKEYLSYDILKRVNPPSFDATTGRWDRVPNITFGGRSGMTPRAEAVSWILNTMATNYSFSATRIEGSHTLKAGYCRYKNFGPYGVGSPHGSISFMNSTNNNLDSQFPFANAALGVFNSYMQDSKWVEPSWTTINNEWFVQDSWKIRSNLTLDYGVRFANSPPSYDAPMQTSNFLPDKWVYADAPKLYVYGCANGVYPCSGPNRQAMNPVTGQFMGSTKNSLVGTIVPGTGNASNGMFRAGRGISKYSLAWASLTASPRFGFAWDVAGKRTMVLRGGFGLFNDRPKSNSVFSLAQNPPYVTRGATIQYGYLQDLSTAGLSPKSVSSIGAFQYDAKIPTSAQWNVGFQLDAPWNTVIDIAYNGKNNYNQVSMHNINTIDLGYAFLASTQDRSTTNPVPGAGSIANANSSLARPMQGLGTIKMQFTNGWSEYHGFTIQWNRRLKNGFGFGVNDAYTLYSKSEVSWRLQHDYSTGAFSFRDDQKIAQQMFGNNVDQRHIFKANFNWSITELKGGNRLLRLATNGWQLTGTYTGKPGNSYAVNYAYRNSGTSINLTGSPDYSARVSVVGDPGSGCSSDPHRQFNAAAFAGPQTGSTGLESSDNYMRGCFQHSLNLSLARNFRFERGDRTYTLQLRMDAFNALNHASITNRNTSMQLSSPADNLTVTNLPYDSNGQILPQYYTMNSTAFGMANGYQSARYVQIQLKFLF
jgi:hypothetical protein